MVARAERLFIAAGRGSAVGGRMRLDQAARLVQEFQRGSLTGRLSDLEAAFRGADREQSADLCQTETLDASVLEAAQTLKSVAGQINVVVHAAGILTALPHILEAHESVESLSLGAGNTGRYFDLETDRRVAEFKFIQWKGGPESIRQNSVFKDFYSLAEAETEKQRYLYLLGLEWPLRFLQGGRSLDSVMSRNAKLRSGFGERYGARFKVVSEYYEFRRDLVRLVDLLPLVPGLAGFAGRD